MIDFRRTVWSNFHQIWLDLYLHQIWSNFHRRTVSALLCSEAIHVESCCKTYASDLTVAFSATKGNNSNFSNNSGNWGYCQNFKGYKASSWGGNGGNGCRYYQSNRKTGGNYNRDRDRISLPLLELCVKFVENKITVHLIVGIGLIPIFDLGIRKFLSIQEPLLQPLKHYRLPIGLLTRLPQII